MDTLHVIALVAGSAVIGAAARRGPVPAPLLLVLAGLAATALPGVPHYALDPGIVIPLLLPPLLYGSATSTSYPDLVAAIRPVLWLAVGYVLFASLAVGYGVHLLVPDIPLTSALVLGAVLAPPDAVAATAIARRLRLPPRITAVLEGESLVNDATAITLFKVMLALAVGEGAGWMGGIEEFLTGAVGGTAVGLALMLPVQWMRRRIREPLLHNTLSLLVPFGAFALAEHLHASGVLAVVVVALYVGHRSWEVDFAARLQEAAVWRMVVFALESVVFALIGLQLPHVIGGLEPYGPGRLARYAVLVFLLVVAGRLLWVFGSTFLPRMLSARIRNRDRETTWRTVLTVGWSGMRGVVSLAVAFSVPMTVAGPSGEEEAFPARSLILFLTFTTVISTLLVQGLTLTPLVRRLKLPGPDPDQHARAALEAQEAASRAAVARLDELLADTANTLPPDLEERLRRVPGRRLRAVGGDSAGPGTPPSPDVEQAHATYRRLAGELLAEERSALVDLRDRGRLDSETMRLLVRRLDLEEAILHSARAAEG
ncbi:Na+/H+ antiporter [Streptomyces sp. NBC_01264]|uniref:Na+/H+ antiporter n=1 Tax=Streptomyces sp. NBC_01264 TaxID=2903804 RepID=UPI00224F8010|nr:Na+/H+ antiporter [Streptomyces sp. NBC_01264]MCX4781833.1 Na+/H+ antiporter [Streptomyces sp. NBC_01264]